jgi:5-methylcytosine-specific restriction protein A
VSSVSTNAGDTMKPCLECGEPATGTYCRVHTPAPWSRRSRPRRGDASSGWERQRRNLRILTRDDYRCYVCGGPAVGVDHVVPDFEGGSSADGNLRAICARCHRVKTARESARGRRQARGG